MIEITVLFLFPWLMAVAAASDLFTMTISNRISVALIAGFLFICALTGIDLDTFLQHLGAGALVLLVCFAMFSMGWIGGGDAKFAACVALWLGFGLTLDFFIVSSLAGGVLTFALIILRSKTLPVCVYRMDFAQRLLKPKGGVPYGIALAVASLIIFPRTVWMEHYLSSIV